MSWQSGIHRWASAAEAPGFVAVDGSSRTALTPFSDPRLRTPAPEPPMPPDPRPPEPEPEPPMPPDPAPAPSPVPPDPDPPSI